MAIDPVCGMQVDEQQAPDTTHFEQKPFYFCSAQCKAEFLRDPRRFIDTEGNILSQQRQDAGFTTGDEAVHTAGFPRDEEVKQERGPQLVRDNTQKRTRTGGHKKYGT